MPPQICHPERSQRSPETASATPTARTIQPPHPPLHLRSHLLLFLSFRAQRGTCFPPMPPQICHPERRLSQHHARAAAEEPVLSEAEGAPKPPTPPQPPEPSNHQTRRCFRFQIGPNFSPDMQTDPFRPRDPPFSRRRNPFPLNHIQLFSSNTTQNPRVKPQNHKTRVIIDDSRGAIPLPNSYN